MSPAENAARQRDAEEHREDVIDRRHEEERERRRDRGPRAEPEQVDQQQHACRHDEPQRSRRTPT